MYRTKQPYDITCVKCKRSFGGHLHTTSDEDGEPKEGDYIQCGYCLAYLLIVPDGLKLVDEPV